MVAWAMIAPPLGRAYDDTSTRLRDGSIRLDTRRVPGADPLPDPALRRAAGAGDRGDPLPARARARAGDGHRGDDAAADRGLPGRLGDRPRRQPRHGLPRPPELRRRPARPHGGPAARRPLGPGDLGPLGQRPRRRPEAGPLPPGQRALALARDRRRLRAGRSSRRRWSSGAAARSPGRPTTWRSVARRTERCEAPVRPATIPRLMAVPKKRTSSARRDKRRANHKAGKARLNQLPALPQPAPAAPGLPDLRHLRRA